jgi:hypothetical protein
VAAEKIDDWHGCHSSNYIIPSLHHLLFRHQNQLPFIDITDYIDYSLRWCFSLLALHVLHQAMIQECCRHFTIYYSYRCLNLELWHSFFSAAYSDITICSYEFFNTSPSRYPLCYTVHSPLDPSILLWDKVEYAKKGRVVYEHIRALTKYFEHFERGVRSYGIHLHQWSRFIKQDGSKGTPSLGICQPVNRAEMARPIREGRGRR